MCLIVQHTELTWCHTMDGSVRKNLIDTIPYSLHLRTMKIWGMTNLETDRRSVYRSRQQVQVMNSELLLICRLWVIALA